VGGGTSKGIGYKRNLKNDTPISSWNGNDTFAIYVYECFFKSRLSEKTPMIPWLLYLLFAHLRQKLVMIVCNQF